LRMAFCCSSPLWPSRWLAVEPIARFPWRCGCGTAVRARILRDVAQAAARCAATEIWVTFGSASHACLGRHGQSHERFDEFRLPLPATRDPTISPPSHGERDVIDQRADRAAPRSSPRLELYGSRFARLRVCSVTGWPVIARTMAFGLVSPVTSRSATRPLRSTVMRSLRHDSLRFVSHEQNVQPLAAKLFMTVKASRLLRG